MTKKVCGCDRICHTFMVAYSLNKEGVMNTKQATQNDDHLFLPGLVRVI